MPLTFLWQREEGALGGEALGFGVSLAPPPAPPPSSSVTGRGGGVGAWTALRLPTGFLSFLVWKPTVAPASLRLLPPAWNCWCAANICALLLLPDLDGVKNVL